ncbi:fumarylacetoacetate hydrolase family protein [Gemmobacter nectariphilus]|uniref:fumarylacetoacetate hydrolase family protein n=1 Tax=Gemmobacter nectariphilus TaxID=220343 RepID=UPI000407BF4E|nr:fumarylacetoacetate hydrolase family protein [Gemmobacter nectariphilus]
MKLVTFRAGVEAPARLGVIADDLVVDVASLGAAFDEALPDSMLGLIDLGRPGLEALASLMDDCDGHFPPGTAVALKNVKLLAPIPRPRKNIFGIGLNYLDHVAESSTALDTAPDLPKQPVVFSKPPTTVIGPGEPIRHNKAITQQLDWEVELAVIIGTTATRVDRAEALDHVFGYSVIIDVSARDNRRAGQWIFSKGMDSYAPFGPCIVTADEIPDPQVLDLWLTINGVEKQRSNTAKMLFKVDELIADLSSGITLEPGDIIATGTPEGVGAGRKPQEWMWPGDTVVACVEGIGTIRHPVIDATMG